MRIPGWLQAFLHCPLFSQMLSSCWCTALDTHLSVTGIRPRLFFPSPIDLDGGQVDVRSVMFVPSVSVQTRAPSDTIVCVDDYGMQMSHGSFAPLTCCEAPPGLVGSHFLDEEAQMQWTPAGVGTEACHARSLTEIHESSPNWSTSGTSCRRETPVENESLPIPSPTPKVVSCLKSVTVSRSLEKLAREVARVRGRPAGKDEHGETSDESGPCRCRSPHGWFLDDDTTVCACWSIIWCVEMEGRKSRSWSEEL